MISLTNYSNGEITISDQEGHSLRLPREKANLLIMSARMHTAQGFVVSLPRFIEEALLLAKIRQLFEHSPSSGRWSLKEKFARLRTLTKDCPATEASQVIEQVKLQPFLRCNAVP